MTTRNAESRPSPNEVNLTNTRSRSFEVFAVTQCLPPCLRVTLVAEDVGTSELTSGQKLTLAHDGVNGISRRWILRAFYPHTKRLTVAAVMGLGLPDARRGTSSVVPGQLVWASHPNEK
jgi:hypothetical protein